MPLWNAPKAKVRASNLLAIVTDPDLSTTRCNFGNIPKLQLRTSFSSMHLDCRLSVQRLRTLQQKKEAQAKASRRDIAFLLEKGKIETARVKVETSASRD